MESRSATKTPRNKNEENGNTKKTSLTPAAAPEVKESGFDKGYTPHCILGASDITGELVFLMKFVEKDGAEMVPAQVANLKCPQIVIKFYEKRLVWHSDPEDDDNADGGDDNETNKTPQKSANGAANDSIATEEENGSADDGIAEDSS